MAGTVATNLAFFVGATTGNSSADTITDWTGVPTPTVDAVQFVQGAGALQSYSAGATTTRTWIFTCASTSVSGKAIYFWFSLGKVAWLLAKSAGGLTIKIERTTSPVGTYLWNVAGNDTLPHNGFICHCIHTDVAPDTSTGTDPRGNVEKITITATSTASGIPGKGYMWVDALRVGTYLAVTGTGAILEDFITAEKTVANQWGVMSKIEGVYYAQGQIQIGTTGQTTTTSFSDTNQVLVFKDSIVTDTFYSITAQGASGYATTLYFGTKSGTQGISGLFIKSASTTKRFTITLTNTYLTIFGLFGSSFVYASSINLPAYDANKEVLNCSFITCAEVISSTTTITNCNFISSTAIAITYSTYLTYCNFIGCANGVEITASQSFVGLIFTNCTYDVKKTNAGAATITNTFNSNAGTYDPAGATVSFVTSVTLILDGLVSNSEVEIVTHGTITEEAHVENSGTSFAYPYNWAANHYVDIFIIKNDYEWYVLWNYLLLNANTTLPISQRIDRNYYNP